VHLLPAHLDAFLLDCLHICLPEHISAVVRTFALLLEHLAVILPAYLATWQSIWLSVAISAQLPILAAGYLPVLHSAYLLVLHPAYLLVLHPAYLLVWLLDILHIWMHIWRSAHLIPCLLNCLPFLPARGSARLLVCSLGCIWQRVWSHINLSGILSARLPVLQAIHLVAHSGAHSARLSIWSSAGLFCCLQAAISSICLFHRPGANPSLHLPIWQAERQSGKSSAHSAATGSIWQHLSTRRITICRPWRFICQFRQAEDQSWSIHTHTHQTEASGSDRIAKSAS
jgi:hypothetical protein